MHARRIYLAKASRGAFTLIEVLVVVAIIALLVAILIPSLARAREQARITTCLANLSSLPKAVLTFAADHKGYGQLVPNPNNAVTNESIKRDASRTKYDYDPTTGQPKLWPVAYAKYLGMKGEITKRNSAYFTNTSDPLETYYARFGHYDVVTCPSDKVRVNLMTGGFAQAGSRRYGVFSYGVNEDVFGAAGSSANFGGTCYRQRVDGSGMLAVPSSWESHRLDGKLDAIDRPSEVAIFADSGRNPGDGVDRQNELITLPGKTGVGEGYMANKKLNGPFLENFDAFRNRLARFRHGDRLGVSVAMADGSGRFARADGWIELISVSGDQSFFARQYLPKIRVSPYGDAMRDLTTQP